MKKELKRYFLVEYCGAIQSKYDTYQELLDVFEEVRKYNRRKTSRYITGNMTYEKVDGKYVLTAHLYNKLLPKSTISDLDRYTEQFDERGLIVDLFDKFRIINEDQTTTKIGYYPDINIAYFEDDNDHENQKDKDGRRLFRKIKYIPVLYNDDMKFLNISYIEKCLTYHAMEYDLEFFEGLLEEFKYSHYSDKEFDELIRCIDKIKNQGVSYLNPTLSNIAYDLYISFIVERQKDGSIMRDSSGKYVYSERRLRDFGFYVKNYGAYKEKEPTKYSYLDSVKKLQELKTIKGIVASNSGEEKKLLLK